jgi:hypothetical protein
VHVSVGGAAIAGMHGLLHISMAAAVAMAAAVILCCCCGCKKEQSCKGDQGKSFHAVLLVE